MKIKTLCIGATLSAICLAGFTSCDDNDDPSHNDENSKVELPSHRMFILNQGSFELNNSGIAFYAPDGNADMIPDIFRLQNGMSLGDTGQDMIIHRGSIYVAVYNSNYLARLNEACVEDARVNFIDDPELTAGVRAIAADGNWIYASFYGGVVAKIDATTLRVAAKLQTGGHNLEDLTVVDGKLYVADSYKIDETGYVYMKEVFVIDLASFKKTADLTVVENPNQVIGEDNKVFVISNTYGEESYVMQMIDPRKSDIVTRLGYATEMCAGDDIIYFVDSRTDWSTYTTTNTFGTYDIKKGVYNRTSFMKNAPEELNSASISMMAVDDSNGDIYIGVTHWTSGNGDMYRFDSDGNYVGKFDTGGQHPQSAVFVD